ARTAGVCFAAREQTRLSQRLRTSTPGTHQPASGFIRERKTKGALGSPARRFSNLDSNCRRAEIGQAPRHYVRRLLARANPGDVDAAIVHKPFSTARSRPSVLAADLLAQHDAAGDAVAGGVLRRRRPRDG